MGYYTDYEMVTHFHKDFNLIAPDVPTILSEKQVINRASWICEEMIELLFATAGNQHNFAKLYDELIVNMYQTFLRQLGQEFPEDVLTAQVDAFGDALYFGNGGFVEMHVDPKPVVQIIHQSNMSKLWEDGLPHYNEVGKVIKPSTFVAPEPVIQEEIQRQIQAANSL